MKIKKGPPILNILALSASTPSQRRKKKHLVQVVKRVLEGPIPKNMTPQNKTFEWVNSYVFSPLKYSPNRFILTSGFPTYRFFLRILLWRLHFSTIAQYWFALICRNFTFCVNFSFNHRFILTIFCFKEIVE